MGTHPSSPHRQLHSHAGEAIEVLDSDDEEQDKEQDEEQDKERVCCFCGKRLREVASGTRSRERYLEVVGRG